MTDIVMPGMRGDDLVHAIVQKERPGIAALYISGYADLGPQDQNAPIVEKPFTFPDLGRRVREALGKNETTAEAQNGFRRRESA